MKVERNIICSQCKGKGSEKEGAQFTCNECQGSGTKVQIFRRGNIIQQTQGLCTACSGAGEVIPAGDKCAKCQGKKTIRDSKIIKVEVPRGSSFDEPISFYGEGDEKPGTITGDLVFILKPKPNDTLAQNFKRQRDHLLINQTIPLVDALLGTSFVIEHLDGHKILASYPGVTSVGDTFRLEGEGMPVKDKPEKFGDLIVTTNIVFPKEISPEQRKALLALFSQTPVTKEAAEGATPMQLVKVDDREKEREGHGQYPESMEEDGQHQFHQSIPCSTQ